MEKMWWEKYFGEETKDKTVKKLNQLNDIAKEMGCSLACLSMSWVIRNKDVSTAITAATKEEQLLDTLKAVEVYKKITPEIEKRINDILHNTPNPDINYKTFTPFAPRR